MDLRVRVHGRRGMGMKDVLFCGLGAFLHWSRRAAAGKDTSGCSSTVSGQAYTEYVVILLFGVLVSLGIVIIEHQGFPGGPQDLGILESLYGYVFDYYAGLANFLNLPLF